MNFEPVTGSDLNLDRDQLVIVRKFRATDRPPVVIGGDYFDYVASAAMGFIVASYPTYATPLGTLFWNSIQLHENHYAQHYDISVTYSSKNKQTGSYQITVDQAVGTTHVTAGTRMAGYAATADDVEDNGGLIGKDGDDVKGCDIPVAEDRITVSYRHPQAYLNAAYIRAVGALRGFPNNDTFLGYDPGEVLYMGGNFTQTDTEASASYTFNVSRNRTNFVVAGITVATKKGWDVLSPVYYSTTGTTGAKTHALRKVKCIEVIRPAGREWKDYVPVFGWGA